MRPTTILALVLIAGGCVSSARNNFQATTHATLRLETIPNTALANAGCTICHTKTQGGPPWNSFGLAVGHWRGKKQDVANAIVSALRYGGDTDRDGYADALETIANTNPNNRDEKPTQTIAALVATLDAQLETTQNPIADNDQDGYADALEVVAGTLPGDANSKPAQTVAALQTEFRDKGGFSWLGKK